MENLVILTTGGTLDKDHDTFTESLVLGAENVTNVPELLRIARTHFPRVQPIMSLDSLDMTEAHREQILGAVKIVPEQHVVITHGTGTMDQTARFLDGKTGDKTVVLTGALRPFALGKSDAGFNVGGAIIAAQTLPPGVYAVMNGRVFKPDGVKKDPKSGRFDL
ncbi:asparaginase domain-containing protein [Ponticaulis profundi]|uniref:Asparaginase domain-containing protein n=1 Tax=Ponticaulis profundi TaxID=2665222 RepID=A0ABW1S8Z9_9PROT